MSKRKKIEIPPAPWRQVRLAEIVEFNPRFDKDEFAGDSLVSFIPMRCVEEESGRFEPLGDRRFAEVCKGYTPFRDGDVIFAKVTPCMENGKVAVLKGLTNGVGFGSTEFFALRPKNGLDARYLFHFILQSNFRKDAARNMTGAVGLRRVPKSFLEQQIIPFPTPIEQGQIVAEIEKQFTRLDAGVAALQRVQANLKRYRAAVLKAACEGRLVPTEVELAKREGRKFESGEQLLERILEERRKNWKGRGKYKDPVAPETDKLAALPNGWIWASPDQLSSSESYSLAIGPFGSNLKVSDYTHEGVPLVFVRNIRSSQFGGERATFVSVSKAAELLAHQVSAGDILVTKMGEPPGDACLYPDTEPTAVITADCIKLRLTELLSQRRFFVHAINSEVIKPQIKLITKGVAQMKVSLGRFETLAFPLPPLAEQTRTVSEVERRLSVVEELEAVVKANLKRAGRLRQAVLQRAFERRL